MPIIRKKPPPKASKKGSVRDSRLALTSRTKKKKNATNLHIDPDYKRYMAEDRAITPVPQGKKDKQPRTIPLVHVAHLVRPKVMAFHHVTFSILLLAICLPCDPISNLGACGFSFMDLLWPELAYIDRMWVQEDAQNENHPDRKENKLIERMNREALIAASVAEEQLRRIENGPEIVFTIAEDNLLKLYPQDGFQKQQWWSKRADPPSNHHDLSSVPPADTTPATLLTGAHGPNATELGDGNETSPAAANDRTVPQKEASSTRLEDPTTDTAIQERGADNGTAFDKGNVNPNADDADVREQRGSSPIREVTQADKDEIESTEEAMSSGFGWPSRTFKSIQWLAVQASAFWESFPLSWKNYYRSRDSDQVATPGQMIRMFGRTDFAHNGLNYLGHADKSIQHVLSVFIEVFNEHPLDVKEGWWSDQSKILEWELKVDTRFYMTRMLFGLACMQHHPDDPTKVLPLMVEPYEALMKAQEYRLALRVHRQIKRLRENAVPYREAYLALTICARLASIAEVRRAVYTSESTLKKAVLPFINTSLLNATQMDVTYRWPIEWYNKDPKLEENEKSMKSQSAVWNLYFLGNSRCPQPFDTVLEQRRSRISRALFRMILPLSVPEMVNVLKRLDADHVTLDLQMLAFHERFFVQATKHVGLWITRHKSVKKGELGMSLAWDFFKNSASHFSVVSSAVGPFITYQTSSLLEPYATDDVRKQLRASGRIAVQEQTGTILSPLSLYDSATRTLGLSNCQVSNRLIATMLGYDLSKTWWPSLQRSDIPNSIPIRPTRSQMLGAFSVLSCIYAREDNAPQHSRSNGKRNGVAQFINDTVGMGKTLQAFMIITGLFHLQTVVKAA